MDVEDDIDEVLSCAVAGDTSVCTGVSQRDRVNDQSTTSVAQLDVHVVAARINEFAVFHPDHLRCRHPGHRADQHLSTVDDRLPDDVHSGSIYRRSHYIPHRMVVLRNTWQKLITTRNVGECPT